MALKKEGGDWGVMGLGWGFEVGCVCDWEGGFARGYDDEKEGGL